MGKCCGSGDSVEVGLDCSTERCETPRRETCLRGIWLLTLACLVALAVGGCSRKYYRVQADRQVAAIYEQKRAEEVYNLPPLPGIDVDPRSRFYDLSPDDCPTLPDPRPQLNDYELPELVTPSASPRSGLSPTDSNTSASENDSTPGVGRSFDRSQSSPDGSSDSPGHPERLPLPEPIPQSEELPRPAPSAPPALIEPSWQDNDAASSMLGAPSVVMASASEPWEPSVDRSPMKVAPVNVAPVNVAPVSDSEPSFVELLAASDDPDSGDNAAGQSSTDATTLREAGEPPLISLDDESVPEGQVDESNDGGLRIVPIPPPYWYEIPETCLPRMLEFESVRSEFRRSFEQADDAELRSLLSDAPRLTLPNIMEATIINSREYQSRKETLYQVALRLTQQRYEFLLRPTRRGNGTALNFDHSRFRGETINGLSIPTGLAVRRTLNGAGQFLASFANDVVLTFNGPQGFSADVGSRLLFDFQQTLLQRDIVFEGLTQAERDVVYAARDLIRFRRELFVGVTSRYYNLLLTYRSIEISSQDYFSNLRAFLQGRAEYLRAGRIPRVQVDQFEQNALESQRDLVGNCNRLESALDSLKLVIGLPPEMPLNLSLGELESLTASDELTVTRQLVQRTKQSLVDSAQGRDNDRAAIVNAAIVLVDRLTDTLGVRRRIEQSMQENQDGLSKTEFQQQALEAEQLGRRLALIEARLQSDQVAEIRQRELDTDVPPPPLIQFARTIDLIDALLRQSRQAIAMRELEASDPAEPADDLQRPFEMQVDALAGELQDLNQQWETAITERRLEDLPRLVERAKPLLNRARQLAQQVVAELIPQEESAIDDIIQETVDQTVSLVDEIASSDVGGLDDVDVNDNEALLTALVQRLDLMNVRGDVADARRQIKLAADDLRAIIDVRATHILRTRSDVNRGFDFTFDDSETRLSLALDTPLNRRIERNNYRLALIGYNAARRALIAQEDQIKFSIREDLRQLRLRRNQYEIAVASAALAYERVVSTRLQLQLAVGNVVARDFLEAQQAYTRALNRVADEHISFILGRVGLFLDMEAIQLDQTGYWDGVDQEQLDLPTRPPFLEANPNPYGLLPPCLKYSDEVRRNH